jgi:hypothetical protein
VGAEVGAGGEVVVAVPGAVDGVGEEDPGVVVEEFESDGGGDGLGDEDRVVLALAGELGREFLGEGGEFGGRGGTHGRGRDGDEKRVDDYSIELGGGGW